jgi:D-proline reductase (dithiol) PrdB
VGLVCRVVEASGIATVCVSTGRDLTAQVNPPRSVFVNHPMGNAFGAPGEVDTQRLILRAALALVETAEEGGVLVDLPVVWRESFEFKPGAYRM